jgi:nicotinamidase-related amidase
MLERLEARRSILVVVDVQERLAAAMPKETVDRLVANADVLLEAARHLSVPVLATEQYPKGLGPTIAPVRAKLEGCGVTPIDKLTFDALSEPRVAERLAQHDPSAVVVLGMESHVCVFQTVRELRRRRIRTIVALDAVASRTEENRLAGLALAERTGAVLMPTESILFDWLERAGTDAFRALSKLIR